MKYRSPSVRLHWFWQDILCLILGHMARATQEGTWCARCCDPLDEKARTWDQIEAEADRQRVEA